MLFQNDPFRDLDAWFGRPTARTATPARPMPMDAYRRGDDVWVHVDMPGISADDVEIDVEGNVLTITGERTLTVEEGDQIYFDERSDGVTRRQVQLGEGLDAESIEADLRDGVLTVRIPVAEQAQPRRIAVKS